MKAQPLILSIITQISSRPLPDASISISFMYDLCVPIMKDPFSLLCVCIYIYASTHHHTNSAHTIAQEKREREQERERAQSKNLFFFFFPTTTPKLLVSTDAVSFLSACPTTTIPKLLVLMDAVSFLSDGVYLRRVSVPSTTPPVLSTIPSCYPPRHPPVHVLFASCHPSKFAKALFALNVQVVAPSTNQILFAPPAHRLTASVLDASSTISTGPTKPRNISTQMGTSSPFLIGV
jgi:hypothetical protein